MRKLTYIQLLFVIGLFGCVPASEREPTAVKKSSEIEISVGESNPESAEAQDTDAEESSSPTTNETVAQSSTTPTSTADTSDPGASATNSSTESSNDSQPTATAANAEVVTGPATFRGRVSVKGSVPELTPLLAKGATTKDQICAAEAVPNQKYVVSADGGLANAFVYMKKAPKSGIPDVPEESVVIDQQGCVFIPHVAIARVGQNVELKNSDPVAHNVNVKGVANQFNNTIPPNNSASVEFEYADRFPAPTVCDFHNWMSAFVLVLDHPWAAVTDENGDFEITGLPDGTWDFVIWHESVGYIERSVKVTAKQNSAPITMDFEVAAAKLTQ